MTNQRSNTRPQQSLWFAAALAAVLAGWTAVQMGGKPPVGGSPLAGGFQSDETQAQTRKPKNRNSAQVFPLRPQPSFEKTRYAPGVVLVAYKDRTTVNRVAQLERMNGLVEDDKIQSPYFKRYFINAQGRAAAPTVDEMVNLLRQNPDVRVAEPDFALTPDQAIPNDARFGELYGLHNTGQTGGTSNADINWPDAWPLMAAGETVRVALMDDGFLISHPDLSPNIFVNPGEVAGNLIDDDGNGWVDDVNGWDFSDGDNNPNPAGSDDHGTHTAGTIAAAANNGIGVAGVATKVQLIPVRMYGGANEWMSALINGIDYARAMDAKVISVSYNIDGFTTFLREAIQRADADDIVYVNSAGNNGQQNPPRQAIRFVTNNTVFVAATDHNDNLASFSNYGTGVDIAAPGVDTLSTAPGNGYQLMSGTSMATPHVAGAVAVVRSLFPTLTDRQALDRLIGTGTVVPGLVGKVVGGKRLNLGASLDNDSIAPSDPAAALFTRCTTQAAEVEFTTSGDDGAVGTASGYEVRTSSMPITVGNFDTAALASVNVPSAPAGQRVRFVLPSIGQTGTTYVAIRALDNVGNPSAGIATTAVNAWRSTPIENAEGAPQFSAISGGWAITTESANSGTRSWTDSPGVNYANNANIELRSTGSYTVNGPTFFRFAARLALETNYDFLYVDISTDNGTTWSNLSRYTGTSGWKGYGFFLPLNSGQSFKVRFRMTSDGSVPGDGVWIDDVYMTPATPVALDNMENTSTFAPGGSWASVTDRFASPIRSWTDSPAGQYANNASMDLTQAASVAGVGDMVATFKAYISTEAGYDYLRVLVSNNGGAYSEAGSWSGALASWNTYSVPIGSPSNFSLKFRFTSDGSVLGDGVWVDDLAVYGEPWRDPRGTKQQP